MINKVAGTDTTKALITNIVKDFKLRRPLTSHVDYSITVGKNSTLLTDENGNNFRNVSIIYLKGIQAAIGNKTGNILIGKKPAFMSIQAAAQKVCDFLEKIQPKNLSKAEPIETYSHILNTPGELNLTPDVSKVTETLKLKGETVKRDITGANGCYSGECFNEYKIL